ncbi:hypothetical protein PVT68_06855 [Microbulbifer bruguierae]|uniref:Uncharacterized protein n=1 Tax=Microbulbifer bruguierae TaxID=3029061 RepID=A0ABY8NHD9_9GAMM|nr:hypothetical protein [Microbulbifer bruguierae]WGL18012.1 hypothetical protein PVT68_06855 [Microbulbifer bruguierae]
MSDVTYSVIFRGDLEPGYTTADVKANFARLFKAGPETLEKLFSGRPLALKKGLGKAQAEQLQATLAKFGAQSTMKVEGEEGQPLAEKVASAPVTPPAPRAEAEGKVRESELTLAPMEGYLVKDNERQKVEPVQVQVSHLSLQPEGGNLVQESEREVVSPVDVQVPDWKLNSIATFKLPD